MNVIQDFESKLKIIGWEKVYSAREIMKTFWYDKWERFVWAINRAKNEIDDEKKKDENFIFIVNKSTGGRPREDVMLTLWACYLVLKKCDGRKENVQKLIQYLQGLIQEKKIESRVFKNTLSYEKIFIVWVAVLFFITFLYYLLTQVYYLSFYPHQYDFSQTVKKELSKEIEKHEKILKRYDDKIHSGIANFPEMLPQVNMDFDFSTTLNNYIIEGDKTLQFVQSQFNQRSEFLKSITGENLIKSYFLLWNASLFRDSCSLLSPKNCFAATKWSLKSFANFWEKTKNGYDILEVRKVKTTPEKNIYCVIYKYKLKYDRIDKEIVEIYNYTTTIKNWYEQISGRFCEKMEKGWKNIACPFQLKTYYCK